MFPFLSECGLVLHVLRFQAAYDKHPAQSGDGRPSACRGLGCPPRAPLSATDRTNLEALARAIDRDRDVLFITGAGLSADSGLPTYRGVGGLYEGTSTASGMSIEESLHIDTFRRRAHLTWHHIRAIADACTGARPNRGHHVIAAMEQALDRVVVLTQNVDGFTTRQTRKP